jgi:hypothetical protein
MGRIGAWVRDSNAWAAWGERLWHAAQSLGISGWISFWVASGIAGGFAITMRLLSATPWYITSIGALIFATYALQFWNKLRIAWSLRGIRKFDLEKFADECCGYYRDFADFSVTRQEMAPAFVMASSEEARKSMQAQSDFRRRTDVLVMQRFAPRAFAIAQQFNRLGIPLPNLFHFSSSDTGGASVYIGMVGELLKKGLLDDARRLDPRMTWGASIH